MCVPLLVSSLAPAHRLAPSFRPRPRTLRSIIPSFSHSNESNATNKSRLRLLELREELLEKAFEDARAKLGETTSKKDKYGALLKGLVLQVNPLPHSRRLSLIFPRRQALFTIMEKDIKVSGRAADLPLVKKAAADAAKEFEAAAGYPVKIEVDGELAAGSYVVAFLLVVLG